MITQYNKYIIKDLVTEKVSFNIKGLLNRAKNEIKVLIEDKVHVSLTVDKQPVKVGSEYYAVFALKTNTEHRRVIKLKIIEALTENKTFKFKKMTLDNAFEKDKKGNQSGTESTKPEDYRLVLKENSKLVDKQEITGFYLYKKEIKNNQIKDIIKRYGYNKNIKETNDSNSDVEILAGNEYKIIDKQGDVVRLTVMDIDGDIIKIGQSYNKKTNKYENRNNNKISNLKGLEYVGTIKDKFVDILKPLYVDSWYHKKDFNESKNQYKFVEEKITQLKSKKEYLEKFIGVKNLEQTILNIINEINKSNDILNGMKSNIDKEDTDNNPNPTEKSNTNVSNEQEQKTVNDIKKGENKASEVQPTQGKLKRSKEINDQQQQKPKGKTKEKN